MFTSNPFAEISASVSPALMQGYIILMVVLVAAGTLFDILHKGSAKYFFENMRRAKKSAAKQVEGGEAVSIAIQTVVVDVLASGEFCNTNRRIAHLLGMYGFVIYVIATVVMVFNASAGAIWTQLWWLGGLMVCIGGYWFWFFIRVDVAAEGQSPFRVMRADLFILSLLASTTLGLIWAAAGGGVGVLFGLYIIATTVLFGGSPTRRTRSMCADTPTSPRWDTACASSATNRRAPSPGRSSSATARKRTSCRPSPPSPGGRRSPSSRKPPPPRRKCATANCCTASRNTYAWMKAACARWKPQGSR
jgi:hypothetical protein